MSLFLRVVCFCILALCTYVTRGDVPAANRWKDPTSASIYLFGAELMQKVAGDSNENVFVSPFSAYLALSMLHLAAKNQSRAKLEEVLKIPQSNTDVSKFHENLSARFHLIQNEPYPSSPETLLSNGLFVDNDFTIRDQYVEQLKKYYGSNATVTNVNFEENVAATETINSWISNSTKNRIRNFVSSSLSKTTRAILTSAIYFKGVWQHKFNETKTTTETFKPDQGGTEMVRMMSQKNDVPYYNDTDLKFHCIELPYEGNEYAMIIILPHLSQTIRNLTQHIHLLNFTHYEHNLHATGVEYKIPKMKTTSTESLLEAMQLENALNALELSEMTPSYREVTIADVRQAAEIEVNENGTTATAVTTDDLEYKSAPLGEPEVVFVVDRPFIVHIVHKATYTLLFSGVIKTFSGPPTPTPTSDEGPSFFLLAAFVLVLVLVLVFAVVFYLRYMRRRDEASYR